MSFAKLNKRDTIALIFCCIGLIALLIGGVLGYSAIFKNIVRKNAAFVLNEISTQHKDSALTGIANDFSHLAHMADAVTRMGDDIFTQAVVGYFQEVEAASVSPTWHMLMDTTGAVRATTAQSNFPIDQEGFRMAMSGQAALSNPSPSPENPDEMVLYLSVPVMRNHTPVAVLTSICPVGNYEPLQSTPVFNGLGYSCIIQSDGMAVALPQDGAQQLPAFSYQENFEQNTQLTQNDKLIQLQQAMQAQSAGTMLFDQNGEYYYLSYTPMGLNDWYLISTVPSHAVFQKLSTIGAITVLVFCLSLLLCGLVIATVYFVRSRRRKELKQLAFHDRLTGLPRFESISRAYNQLGQEGRGSYACALINVNRRQLLRNTFSQGAAEELIRRIAARLKSYAANKGHVCALGDDRFLLLLQFQSPSSLLSEMRILTDQLEMIKVTEAKVAYEFHCTFTCGAYLLTADDTALQDVLHLLTLGFPATDTNAERSTCALVDQQEKRRLLMNMQLIHQVDRAFQIQEFVPFFQPQYDLASDRVVGAEVLARWQHHEHGLLLPGAFVPALESSGKILELDLYMLEAACKEIRRWTDAELLPVPVTVNISPLNIYKPDFVDKVIAVVKSYQIPPVLIVLEMSEVAAMENNGVYLRDVIQRLHDAGLLLSLDDFGSGSSSLTLLPALAIDILKLGKAFYGNGVLNKRERAILDGVVNMAKLLDVQVVAQNVEKLEQAQLLLSAGCYAAQGYLYSKPLSSAEFESIIF